MSEVPLYAGRQRWATLMRLLGLSFFCSIYFHRGRVWQLIRVNERRRLPGNGNSNSHGARPVHSMIKWIRTSRLSIKNSLRRQLRGAAALGGAKVVLHIMI